MEKFLIFIDAADDAAMYPVSGLLGMTVAADATLLIKFGSSIGSGGTDGSAADIITVTTTADKELVVFKALAKAIADIGAFNSEKFLVVCDDVNSVFAHPDILSCTLAVDS
jgi:hypothetical protein